MPSVDIDKLRNNRETVSLDVNPDWFDVMTKKQQDKYLRDHPNSKMAKKYRAQQKRDQKQSIKQKEANKQKAIKDKEKEKLAKQKEARLKKQDKEKQRQQAIKQKERDKIKREREKEKLVEQRRKLALKREIQKERDKIKKEKEREKLAAQKEKQKQKNQELRENLKQQKLTEVQVRKLKQLLEQKEKLKQQIETQEKLAKTSSRKVKPKIPYNKQNKRQKLKTIADTDKALANRLKYVEATNDYVNELVNVWSGALRTIKQQKRKETLRRRIQKLKDRRERIKKQKQSVIKRFSKNAERRKKVEQAYMETALPKRRGTKQDPRKLKRQENKRLQRIADIANYAMYVQQACDAIIKYNSTILKLVPSDRKENIRSRISKAKERKSRAIQTEERWRDKLDELSTNI